MEEPFQEEIGQEENEAGENNDQRVEEEGGDTYRNGWSSDIGTQVEWSKVMISEETQVLKSPMTGSVDEQGQVGAGYLSPQDGRRSSIRLSLPYSTYPSVGYQAASSTRTNSSVGVAEDMEDMEYEPEEDTEDGALYMAERRVSLSDKQADAYIMARPIGYKNLRLLPGTKNPVDKETQVIPGDLQKAAALLRGIVYDQQNVLWPSNGDFTIGKAERRVEEYITRCWKVCPQWFFHVKYLHCVTGCYRNKYIYEVKWSMPTKEYPIPKATASVYFIFDVEIYGGREETVKVHYVIEGHRYPHVPGEVPFQQKWISSIICEKIRMQRSVGF